MTYSACYLERIHTTLTRLIDVLRLVIHFLAHSASSFPYFCFILSSFFQFKSHFNFSCRVSCNYCTYHLSFTTSRHCTTTFLAMLFQPRFFLFSSFQVKPLSFIFSLHVHTTASLKNSTQFLGNPCHFYPFTSFQLLSHLSPMHYTSFSASYKSLLFSLFIFIIIKCFSIYFTFLLHF